MIVSTRGRYALYVLMDLAGQGEGSYTALKDIAEQQGLSHKYVEGIMGTLSKAGLVEGVHGRGGGYRLTRPLGDYSLGEILRLTEGDLAPVSCLEQGAETCANAGVCRTRPVWDRLNQLINDYLDSVTLEDLIEERSGSDAEA